jgi:hypothetical protein
MHRSGTSAITRAVQALGVDLGNDLLKAQSDNPKGFFEDRDILKLNNKILSAANRDWQNLEPLDADLLADQKFARFRSEADDLLKKKLREKHTLCIKDPRLSILMPFWRSVFEDLDLRVSYVVAVRNPLEVAQSLYTRDALPIETGILLWSTYMLQALEATRGQQGLLVSYEQILQDPLAQLNRMAKALDLPAPEEASPEIREFVESFLDMGLRNQVVSDDELRQSERVYAPVSNLYQSLRSHAEANLSGETLLSDPASASLINDFRDLKPVYHLIDRLREEASQADLLRHTTQKAHDEACRQRDDLAARLEDLQARHVELDQQRHTIQLAHDEACRQRDDLAARLEDLQARHIELDQQRHTIQLAHDEACRQRDDLAARLEDLQARHIELDQQRHAIQLAHDEACRQRDDLAARLEDLQARHVELDQQRHTIQLAHDEACRQRDELGARLEDLQARFAELDAQHQTTQDALDELNIRHEEQTRNYAALSAHFANLKTEATGTAAQAETLWAISQHQAQRLAELQDALARAEAQTATYANSASMKITAPLRGIARILRGVPKARSISASTNARIWGRVSHSAQSTRLPPPEQPPRILAKANSENLSQGASFTAIILHASSAARLEDVVARIDSLDQPFKLYLTANGAIAHHASALLAGRPWPYLVIETDERGRDASALMTALPHILADQADLILKLQLLPDSGPNGGQHIISNALDTLLNSGAVTQARTQLQNDPLIGILAPPGHILPVSAFAGSNQAGIEKLSSKIRINAKSAKSAEFVAGAMYFATPDVFAGLNTSGISATDFDPECGQTDGTSVHAFERLSGAIAGSQGLRIEALSGTAIPDGLETPGNLSAD